MLLVGTLAFAPQHAAPELTRPEFRGRWAWLAGLLALAAVLWLYRGAIVQAAAPAAIFPPLTPAVISGALFAPLVEEWIFRGVLWRQLAPAGAPPRAAATALLATSIAFGLWHLPFADHAPIHVHALFGAAMGLLRWRTGSIVPGIALHGLGNLLSFVR